MSDQSLLTRPVILKRRVGPNDPRKACALLALHSGLSKAAVKDAMIKGAVWLQRAHRGRHRLRRATTELREGDTLELYYDPTVLTREPSPAHCVADTGAYSVWHKPPGLLAQGNDYGDHCALERVVEKAVGPRPVFLIHRLDREAAGLMLFAHNQVCAAKLSRLFQQHRVTKHYRIEVRGDLAARHGARGLINLPLDGREALTEYTVREYDTASDSSIVEVVIKTGRLHQIRRHFEGIGFPVLGDPRYGRNNNDARGLQLVAVGLEFDDPLTGRTVHYRCT